MKPGESHSYYTDEEETPTNKLHLKNPKQCESEKPTDIPEGNSPELLKTETKEKDYSDGHTLNNSDEKVGTDNSSFVSAKQDDSKNSTIDLN